MDNKTVEQMILDGVSFSNMEMVVKSYIHDYMKEYSLSSDSPQLANLILVDVGLKSNKIPDSFSNTANGKALMFFFAANLDAFWEYEVGTQWDFVCDFAWNLIREHFLNLIYATVETIDSSEG